MNYGTFNKQSDTSRQSGDNKTRLLGRPQPQMYPPVALNQYTLVNRTHKHYIYMLHKHLKIPVALNQYTLVNRTHNHYIYMPTNILKSHQNSTIAKYGSNLMNIFSFWGVLGKRMLNPEVLNCHEDIITLDTYAQQGKTMVTMAGDKSITYIYVQILTSLAIWGPGGGGGGGGA